MTTFTAFELNRLIQLLPITDPKSGEYGQLLYNFEKLACATETIDTVLEEIGAVEADGRVVVSMPKVVELPVPREPSEESTDSSDKEEPGEVEPETAEAEHRSYEMTDVRAALVEARKRGVNVTELLHEFGVDNFGAFPAGRYGELMEKLEADA